MVGDDHWVYRIEPYQWTAPGSWVKAKEADANTWFLFGEKGADQRVFGVFSSRVGAEDTVAKLMSGSMGKEYIGEIDQRRGGGNTPENYQQVLAEAANRPANDKDRGIDR